MPDKPIHRVSMAGWCPKQRGAMRLGMGEAAQQGFSSKAMMAAKEGNRHEWWVISDLMEEWGYEVEYEQVTGHLCGNIRATQIEIVKKFRDFWVIGHLDGTIKRVAKGTEFMPTHMLEVKSFNESRWELFDKWGLDMFPKYAAQVSLAMDMSGLPVFYVYKNRGTGEMKWIILDDPPMEPSPLYKTMGQIERASHEGLLLPCGEDAEWYFCPFLNQGLCDVRDNREEGLPDEIESEHVLALVEDYVMWKKILKEGEASVAAARAELIEIAGEEGGSFIIGDQIIKVAQRTSNRLDLNKVRSYIDDDEVFQELHSESSYPELRVTERKPDVE